MKENVMVLAPAGMVMEYIPLVFVVAVDDLVLSDIFTPGSAEPSAMSVTVPDMVLVCAFAENASTHKSEHMLSNSKNFLYIIKC